MKKKIYLDRAGTPPHQWGGEAGKIGRCKKGNSRRTTKQSQAKRGEKKWPYHADGGKLFHKGINRSGVGFCRRKGQRLQSPGEAFHNQGSTEQSRSFEKKVRKKNDTSREKKGVSPGGIGNYSRRDKRGWVASAKQTGIRKRGTTDQKIGHQTAGLRGEKKSKT